MTKNSNMMCRSSPFPSSMSPGKTPAPTPNGSTNGYRPRPSGGRRRVGARTINTLGVNRSTKIAPILTALRSVFHRSINSLPNSIPRVHLTGDTRSIVEAVIPHQPHGHPRFVAALCQAEYVLGLHWFSLYYEFCIDFCEWDGQTSAIFCNTRLISLHS